MRWLERSIGRLLRRKPAAEPGATPAELDAWAKSQHGEDRYILGLLEGTAAAPFVVDVGANDGFSWSNSYLFGKLGYDLLLIEPMPAYAEFCRQLYAGDPKVQVVEAAISFEAGQADFFVNLDADNDLLAMGSSLGRNWVPSDNVRKITVRTEPLDAILERAGCPSRYALLSVDAEGHDPAVLASTDLTRFQPQIICVEDGVYGDLLTNSLAERGYEMLTRLGPNGIYRRMA